MEPFMDTKPGPWGLLVLPQYLQPEMVHVIVQLAEHGDVSAAICNNPYLIRLLGLMEQDGQYQVRGKITLNQPFTCLELAGLLDWMYPTKEPFLVLDFLGVFQGHTLPFKARKAVLKNCIKRLDILSKKGRVIASVSPIVDPNSDVHGLLEILQKSAPEMRTELPIYPKTDFPELRILH
jgi:hypothetical protein